MNASCTTSAVLCPLHQQGIGTIAHIGSERADARQGFGIFRCRFGGSGMGTQGEIPDGFIVAIHYVPNDPGGLTTG